MSELVSVVGAGIMGAQIGAEYALGGAHVTLVTRSDVSAADSVLRAHAALDALAEYGLAQPSAVAAAKSRIRGSTDIIRACAGSDLIIESLPEALALKAATLRPCPSGFAERHPCYKHVINPDNSVGERSRSSHEDDWDALLESADPHASCGGCPLCGN